MDRVESANGGTVARTARSHRRRPESSGQRAHTCRDPRDRRRRRHDSAGRRISTQTVRRPMAESSVVEKDRPDEDLDALPPGLPTGILRRRHTRTRAPRIRTPPPASVPIDAGSLSHKTICHGANNRIGELPCGFDVIGKSRVIFRQPVDGCERWYTTPLRDFDGYPSRVLRRG